MLAIENTGLIVVDIQGQLARMVQDSANIISRCHKLIQGALILELPIVLLEQNPTGLGATVVELDAPLSGIRPISKFTFDGCSNSDFIDAVTAANANTWLICGIEAHICVYQTGRGLINRGFQVEIVSDCVSSRAAANIELGINRLKELGANVTGLEMCLFELVKDCKAPAFKSILELVR